MIKEGYQYINYKTPGVEVLVLGRGHASHIVKINGIFKNLLYSQVWIRQTKYIVIMTKEGSTKILNFMTPGAGVLVQGLGKSYSENALSSTLSIYSTLIAIVLS